MLFATFRVNIRGDSLLTNIEANHREYQANRRE